MRLNRDKRFKRGDLVKFIDIHTSIDVLLPFGYSRFDSWLKFVEKDYEAKKDDIGIVVIPRKKNLSITYAQVMVNGNLYWFDVDNLECLEVYSV